MARQLLIVCAFIPVIAMAGGRITCAPTDESCKENAMGDDTQLLQSRIKVSQDGVEKIAGANEGAQDEDANDTASSEIVRGIDKRTCRKTEEEAQTCRDLMRDQIAWAAEQLTRLEAEVTVCERKRYQQWDCKCKSGWTCNPILRQCMAPCTSTPQLPRECHGYNYCGVNKGVCNEHNFNIVLSVADAFINVIEYATPMKTATAAARVAWKAKKYADAKKLIKEAMKDIAKQILKDALANYKEAVKANMQEYGKNLLSDLEKDFILEEGAEQLAAAALIKEDADAKEIVDTVAVIDPTGIMGVVSAIMARGCDKYALTPMPERKLFRRYPSASRVRASSKCPYHAPDITTVEDCEVAGAQWFRNKVGKPEVQWGGFDGFPNGCFVQHNTWRNTYTLRFNAPSGTYKNRGKTYNSRWHVFPLCLKKRPPAPTPAPTPAPAPAGECSDGMYTVNDHSILGYTCKTCDGSSRRRRTFECTACEGSTKSIIGSDDCGSKYSCVTNLNDASCKTCVSVADRTKTNHCASCRSGYILNRGRCDKQKWEDKGTCREAVWCSDVMRHRQNSGAPSTKSLKLCKDQCIADWGSSCRAVEFSDGNGNDECRTFGCMITDHSYSNCNWQVSYYAAGYTTWTSVGSGQCYGSGRSALDSCLQTLSYGGEDMCKTLCDRYPKCQSYAFGKWNGNHKDLCIHNFRGHTDKEITKYPAPYHSASGWQCELGRDPNNNRVASQAAGSDFKSCMVKR